MPRITPPLPPPVRQALRQLGADLRLARRRQHMPVANLARRAGISRSTLTRVERGDPAVALGIYARIFDEFGRLDQLRAAAEDRSLRANFASLDALLPQRLHAGRRRRAAVASPGPNLRSGM